MVREFSANDPRGQELRLIGSVSLRNPRHRRLLLGVALVVAVFVVIGILG